MKNLFRNLAILLIVAATGGCDSQSQTKSVRADTKCEVPKTTTATGQSAKLVEDLGSREIPGSLSQCSLANLSCMVHIYVPNDPAVESPDETIVRRMAAEYCLPQIEDLGPYPMLAEQSGCLRIDRLDIPSTKAEDPLYSCSFNDYRASLSSLPISGQSDSLLKAMEAAFRSCRDAVRDASKRSQP